MKNRRTNPAYAVIALLMLLTSCDSGQRSGPLSESEQWTFVNYWAVWCKPCIKEIPELNDLNALAGYQVLGVNFDGVVGEELAEQVERLSIEFSTLDHDPAERLGTTRPQVLPTTLLLNPSGQLVASLIGPQTQATLLDTVAKAQASSED